MAIGLGTHGPEPIRAHLQNLFMAVPHLSYEVTNRIMVDDQVVVEWVVTGAYHDDCPGLPPGADQPFTFSGASIFVLADGKIRRYTEYWDAYTFLVQLGALTVPGNAASGTPTASGTPAANTL
jgi:steroid delta-isomerase-like uncharacterized protein